MGNHQKKRLAAKIHNENYVARQVEKTVFSKFVDLMKEKAAMLMHNFTDSTLYIRNAV